MSVDILAENHCQDMIHTPNIGGEAEGVWEEVLGTGRKDSVILNVRSDAIDISPAFPYNVK